VTAFHNDVHGIQTVRRRQQRRFHFPGDGAQITFRLTMNGMNDLSERPNAISELRGIVARLRAPDG
jgi:hypothetical protein